MAENGNKPDGISPHLTSPVGEGQIPRMGVLSVVVV